MRSCGATDEKENNGFDSGGFASSKGAKKLD